MAKIAEVIAHPIICLFAFRFKGKGCRWLNLDGEQGVVVEFDGELHDDVGCVARGLGNGMLRGAFEWALEAEEMVE